MLERPSLSDDEIAGALQAHHGFHVSAITFLPIGNDVNSFAFKVIATDGATYFLKARRGEINLPALVIPCFLLSHGVPAVAPIATSADALFVEAGDFKLILYPFIDGENAMDAGMSDAQWITFGAALRRMHDLTLPAETRALLPCEDFSAYPYFQDVLQRVDALVSTTSFQNDTQRDLADFWRSKAGVIMHIARRARELGQTLKTTSWRGMLCHADIHTANVLIDSAGAIHFIDWDQPLFAPKERDLMFVMGDQEALFFQGYGETKIDWQMMAYYRHWWVVQDVGDYAGRVFLMPDVSDEVRTHAATGLKAMFDAGDVVAIAHRSDQWLNESRQ